MDPAELMKLSKAQRIAAALNEAKWLEPAFARLRNPTVSSSKDLGKVAKDVTDIGKHGARSASQLSKAGAPNADVLGRLFDELIQYQSMDSKSIAAAFKEGRFGAIEAEIAGKLGELRVATKQAVDGLRDEFKTFSGTADDMAELQRLLLWQVRYSAMADKAIQATSSVMKLYKAALSEQIEQSVQEPEPNKSEAPASTAPPSGSASAPAPAGAPTG
jgi:hypothetical protein